ncbi:MAG: DNA repair protein RecN [Dehalococcoidia bacterium]
MLAELDIRDLAVAEHVRVTFAHGLTAITGETGAGKSIIIDALELLLGGRADPALVRSGATAARVEGIFFLPEGPLPEDLLATLVSAGIEPDDRTLIVSREVAAGGRARTARINGQAVVLTTLIALGSRLVDVHGQTDHVALLQPAEHIRHLDRFAGTAELRRTFAAEAQRLRHVRAEIARLQTDARERLRRQERLEYEVAEIEAAALRPNEEAELRAERTLLESAGQRVALAESGYTALLGGGRGTAAVDALGHASEALAELAAMDPRLSDEAVTAAALQEQATDLARVLRSYRDEVEHNPARLSANDERLSLILTLKRKYGVSIDEVLTYAEQAATELAGLAGSEERREDLEHEADRLLKSLAVIGAELSAAREAAAVHLVEALVQQLSELSMSGARFAVSISRRAAADGLPVRLPLAVMVGGPTADSGTCVESVAFDQTGLDRLEFYVSFNPGEELRPLARVASGGETSRLMLALKTVLGDADAVPTLVFDEIEAGLGGRTGAVVGEKLAALAGHHQVICITHLPQIAARADQHLSVIKTVENGRTRARVTALNDEDRVRELAAMMGSVSATTLAGAREMLDRPLQRLEEHKIRAT